MNQDCLAETTERPAAAVWLDAWERGMAASLVRRPAVLLETFHGSAAAPASWALGRREAALLELRATLFGATMESVAACPECGGLVEFAVKVDEILAGAPPGEPPVVTVDISGVRGVFRLPHTGDLEAAARVPAVQRRRFLINRCLVECASAETLPEEFLAAVARQMEEADPLGDVCLHLSCPECRHVWDAPLDAGSFLWSELNSWATRLMSEIHLLAASFGWSEPEILALPPHRRRFYLDRLQA